MSSPGVDSISKNHLLLLNREKQLFICESFIVRWQQFSLQAPGFPGGASGKEPACQCRGHGRLGSDLWVGKTPWRRAWQPTPVFLPGEAHGQRSLAGYSPWGHKQSGMAEVTRHSTSHSSSLAVSTTSAVTSSMEVLNPSKSSTRIGTNFFQTPVNVNILTSSYES